MVPPQCHACPQGWLDRVNKAIHQFVWRGFTKVSIAQCMFNKSELGLGLWDMKSKAEGLWSKWIVSYLQGKLNPYLKRVIDLMGDRYANVSGSVVPLWQSRVDHSLRLTQVT